MPPAVNVVDPHPLLLMVAGTTVKLGNTILIVSETFIKAFKTNSYTTVVGAEVAVLEKYKLLWSRAGVTVAVEDKIAVAPMSATALKVTATVRVAKLAAWALPSVTIPDGIVTVQVVSAGKVAPAAVKTNFAALVVLPCGAAVNVVELQPLTVGLMDEIAKFGRVTSRVSPTSRATSSAKVKATGVGAVVTGFDSTNDDFVSTGVAVTVAVDVVICAAAMLVASAKLMATVRLARLALCATAGADTPDPSVATHFVLALNVFVAAVSVKRAVDESELAFATANVVVPHPFVVMEPSVPNVNIGSTSTTSSFTASFAFSLNEYEIEVAEYATGLAISRALRDDTGTTVAVEDVIAVAAILPVANVTATV